MIRVRQIEVSILNDTEENIKKQLKKKLNVNEIIDYKINKKSIDARHKDNIKYIYEIDVKLKDENIKYTNDIFKIQSEEYKFEITGKEKLKNKIVVVGSGPAGLFASYMLQKNGYNIILIERGDKVEEREKKIEEFWTTNKLDENSNVQFGEGGAGTFSDGKLNTLKKDENFRMKEVFKTFVKFGAPKDILYLNKPHIGTNYLKNVVKNMREEIINLGGEVRFNTCLTNVLYKNNKVYAIEVNNKEIIETENVILAIGNSARDTYEMLYKNNIEMKPKPFAIGIRIQHPQKMIDESQYGKQDILEKATYKLTHQASNKRGVYTFCMCPGGYVVNASSEKNRIVVNGMSNYERDTENANSAVIVTVSPNDFGENPLDGIKFQRDLEEKAYNEGKGLIPIQTYKGFKENKICELGEIKPIIKGNYNLSNINNILPSYVIEALKEGIDIFGKKLKGFDHDDSILAAIETRTSAPIRILRNEEFNSNIEGIYPIGEGAGYAGGITTSAIDGIKMFEQIIKKYKN